MTVNKEWFCPPCVEKFSKNFDMQFETKTIANAAPPHGWQCRCGEYAKSLMPGLARALDNEAIENTAEQEPFKVADVQIEQTSPQSAFSHELQFYKHFFEVWDAFQTACAGSSVSRKQQAAQDLVQAADLVRNFRDPLSLMPTTHG